MTGTVKNAVWRQNLYHCRRLTDNKHVYFVRGMANKYHGMITMRDNTNIDSYHI